MMRLIALGGALALAACATGGGGDDVGGGGTCDAEAAQGLIGQQASSALGQRAMQLSGARTLRWIPEGSAVTMDYRPDRLNVEYDRSNVVTEIRCG